ncbi:hypothetical protein SRHO_G00129540 [Serrasalmus rhombeus]
MICCINTLSWIAAVQCGELTASDYDPMTDALDNNLQYLDVKPPGACAVCKIIVEGLIKYVEGRLRRRSFFLCMKFRRELRKQCLIKAQEYKDKVINTLFSGGPKRTCQKYNAFTANSSRQKTESKTLTLHDYVPDKDKDDDKGGKLLRCFVCKRLMRRVIPSISQKIHKMASLAAPPKWQRNPVFCCVCQDIIKQTKPKINNKIQMQVNKICSKFIKVVKGKCENLGSRLRNKLLKVLFPGPTPKDTCRRIKLCMY